MPLIAADALRAAALLSLALGIVLYGWLGFALFFLVLGGCFLPRAIGLPQPLDAATCATFIFGAWAAQLDWYVAVPWLDLVVHAVATGLISVLAWQTLRALRDMRDTPATRLETATVIAALGTALAGVWELGEWGGHTWLDKRIQVGCLDTIGDLVAGALGAVVAGVAVGSWRRPR